MNIYVWECVCKSVDVYTMSECIQLYNVWMCKNCVWDIVCAACKNECL